MQLAIVHLTDLKSDVHNGRVNDPETIVNDFLQIDYELRSAFSDAPTAWDYQIVPSTKQNSTNSCVPEHIHMYKSSLSAQLRNTMRNGRITCHTLIVCTLTDRPSDIPLEKVHSQIQQSRNIMRQLQTEILASVPQHLGLESVSSYEAEMPVFELDRPLCPSRDMFQVANTSSDIPVLRTPRDHLLLWNLIMAGRVAEPGGPLRKAVREMLIYAGRRLGMSQAFIFARALEDDSKAFAALGFKSSPHSTQRSWNLGMF